MTILAWHFVGDTLRDGRPIPPDGEWLEHTGQLFMCRSGLHASRQPFNALKYAPGPILCRVECAGEIVEEADKLVCTRRRILKRGDMTEMLWYFARMQALSVVHLWDAPDVVLDYLMTGDESIRATARAAARDAARAAARAAAIDAASDAAWDAAWAAAWDAAWDAAWAAAAAAAWAAAWEAARDAARAAARAAARDAAWEAAWEAAWDAAISDFNALVEECFS